MHTAASHPSMKREMLSQCYTTKWRDIPLARLG
ncbi:DUF4113 domain-containing protein [Escherichia coli]|nr:DUF4113 domain-containing protein [Escherichia coli]